VSGSVERKIVVQCDMCEAHLHLEGDEDDVWASVEGGGWSKIFLAGEVYDLCPKCTLEYMCFLPIICDKCREESR